MIWLGFPLAIIYQNFYYLIVHLFIFQKFKYPFLVKDGKIDKEQKKWIDFLTC